MKTFKYLAVDAEGRSVAGIVDAADWDAAQALLATRGLVQCQPAPLADADHGLSALSKPDAIELASYLSQLAKAGLPLGGGLRALARDLRTGSLPIVMQDLAARLEAGHDLESALGALGSRLPVHLREVIAASARSGRLAQTLDPMLAHERSIDEMTRQFWQSVAYPAALLVFLIGWLLFVTLWFIPQMEMGSLLEDIGDLSERHGRVNNLAEFSQVTPPLLLATIASALAVVAVARLIGGRALVSRLFAELPLLGPAWRYLGLAEFSGLLSVFLDQQLTLREALELTALASRDPSIAVACRGVVADVSTGQPLSDSLEKNRVFPPTLINLVEWGQRHAALPDAMEAARRMFSERFELQTQLVRFVLPPAVFLLVGATAFFTVTQFLGEMVSLFRFVY